MKDVVNIVATAAKSAQDDIERIMDNANLHAYSNTKAQDVQAIRLRINQMKESIVVGVIESLSGLKVKVINSFFPTATTKQEEKFEPVSDDF